MCNSHNAVNRQSTGAGIWDRKTGNMRTTCLRILLLPSIIMAHTCADHRTPMISYLPETITEPVTRQFEILGVGRRSENLYPTSALLNTYMYSLYVIVLSGPVYFSKGMLV
jgi:hypothetical protein